MSMMQEVNSEQGRITTRHNTRQQSWPLAFSHTFTPFKVNQTQFKPGYLAFVQISAM